MLSTMPPPPDSRQSSFAKKSVQPTVVQLGSTLPFTRGTYDVKNLWTMQEPQFSKTYDPNKRSSSKCRKYRNLFEYEMLHKNKLDLKRSMWKIPTVSTNIIPTKQERVYKPEIGLYEPSFQDWYTRLVHENTVVLPPIQTSQRKKHELYDSSRLVEKKYIAKQLLKSGPVERFERDELHVPDVYSQCYTCAECRKSYVRDVYTKRFATRNSAAPPCSYRKRQQTKMLPQQHCDVLGERYCAACIEDRDKNFSKKIEKDMLSVKDLRKIHYNKYK